MTKKLELYRCDLCHNLVEVVLEGDGELVCCGLPMILVEPKTEEFAKEKHVPFITKNEDGIEVRIGEIPHPMDENHYIMFIEVISEDGKYVKRKYLQPGEEAFLKLKCDCEKFSAREFCSLHGLWENKA